MSYMTSMTSYFPYNIRIHLIFPQNYSMAYTSVAESIGLPSFKFVRWAPNDATVLQQSAFWLFKVIQSR